MDVWVIDFFRVSSLAKGVGASDVEGEENPEEKPEDELVVEIDHRRLADFIPLLSLPMLDALSFFVKLSELYEPELERESFSVDEDELDEGEGKKPGDAGGDTDEGKLR